MSKKLRNWGWDGPRLEDARSLAPETPAHRSRKSTRKWCRGKEGVEHVLSKRISKWGVSILQRHPASLYAGCGWKQRHRWVVTAETRDWLPIPNEWKYNCNHEEYCTGCGKIMKHTLKAADCPEWKPKPS